MDYQIDESLQKLSIASQKCDNAEYDEDDDAADADGHMILMCWLCDSKKRVRLFEEGATMHIYIYMGSSPL